ncbi:hypothetical protein VIGAN_01202300 [Vigna angularis var. angularis]|uniref:Uncharacterized protein n=1 Tax=Vigna angularis var. angularis TaxID=157739 RepID=A0A0S3R1K5_PHAAN|nr:hypothetical protein VIGAN_01202300 [Vigna angularis var. angularis]
MMSTHLQMMSEHTQIKIDYFPTKIELRKYWSSFVHNVQSIHMKIELCQQSPSSSQMKTKLQQLCLRSFELNRRSLSYFERRLALEETI